MMLLAGILLAGAAWGQDPADRRINRVDLDGLQRVSEGLVRSQIESQAGDTYSAAAVARDLRRLYDLQFFATIAVSSQLEPDGGLILTYLFEEKRVIDAIRITGNDRIRARNIRAELNWREGDSFIEADYPDELTAITRLYQSKGYPNAAVDILVEETAPGRVRLTYTIMEGLRARVSDIRFEGNETLSDRNLRGLFQTKRAWWFLGGRYDESVFETDLERMVDHYGDYGRLEAEVDGTEFTFSDTGRTMDIVVRVNEGPEYTVGALQIAGNIVYDDDEVRDIIAVQEGAIHNRSQVAADADLIQQGYADSGYVDAMVSPQVALDRDAKTTSVVHNIREGDMRYVREIIISGNRVTRDTVIRRNVLLIPGDRFDGGLIRYSQRQLDNMRYFDSTRFSIEPIPEDDTFANLLLDVDEGRTSELGFGAGYNTDEGVGGFVDLRLRNFDIMNWRNFQGGGQRLNSRVFIGESVNQFNISFMDPEFLDYPLGFGFDLFNEKRDFRGANFTEEARGVGVRFAKNLSPFVGIQWGARHQQTSIANVPVFASRELRQLWTDDGSTNSIFFQFTRSTLDNRMEPVRGSEYSLITQLAGMGDHEFYKVEWDSSFYRPLTQEDRLVAMWRFRAGLVDDLGKPGFVSLSDRFYAGGTTTVRGYGTRDIGPKLRRFGFFGEEFRVGGNFRVINNLEARYRFNELLRFYTFVDGGGVYADASDFDFGEMKWSAGVGFGVNVPRLGPIRIDYGVPLNADSDQGSGRWHLTTGFRF
jgi:outer membrane protein insertion porin family